MGKPTSSVANLNASAKRRPLSLKSEWKSPKKLATKIVCCPLDKENHGNVNCNQLSTNLSKDLHKHALTLSKTNIEESQERLTLRRKVEQAVALHLAERSAELAEHDEKPLPVEHSDALEDSDDLFLDSVVEDSVVEGSFVLEDMSMVLDSYSITDEKSLHPIISTESNGAQKLRTIIAILLVIGMTIWSGVRVVLLEPERSVALYQPRPALHRATELAVTSFAAPIVETLHTIEMGEFKIFEETIKEEPSYVVLEQATPEEVEADASTERTCDLDTHHHAAIQRTGSVTQRTVVVVALDEKPASHTQVVLRRALGGLSPLKKLVSKLHDRFLRLVLGIATLFRLHSN